MNFKATAIVGAVSVALIAVLWYRNQALSAEVSAAEQTLAAAVSVNESMRRLVGEMNDRIDQCVMDREVDLNQNAAVIAGLEQEMETLRERRPEVIREEIYRDPSCAELGELDISGTCPALSERLLDIANRLDGG